jgi:hypothetical protein
VAPTRRVPHVVGCELLNAVGESSHFAEDDALELTNEERHR